MPLLLTQPDLEPLINDPARIRDALSLIEDAVERQSRGEGGHATYLQFPMQSPPGLDVYATSGSLGATVRVFPERLRDGVSDNHVMLYFSHENGALLALLCGDELNPLRTSLPAGLGAVRLAPAGAKSLAILGSGQQAAGHLRVICAGLPEIDDIRVYSPTPANREAFAARWRERLGKRVVAHATARDAMNGADIVALTGHVTRMETRPEAAWIKPGATVTTMVGAPLNGELKARIVVPAFKRPQTVFPRMMKPAEGSPPPPPPRPPMELAAILRGEVKAREQTEDVVLYSIAAPYAWDAPVMRWAYEWARARGVGTEFNLS